MVLAVRLGRFGTPTFRDSISWGYWLMSTPNLLLKSAANLLKWKKSTKVIGSVENFGD